MICPSTSTSGRINAFQRLMLQWSELHPYNAAHIYRIARPMAPETLAEAVRQTYSATGIGIVDVDTAGLTFRYEKDREPDVEVVDGGEDPESRLAEHLTRELNRRFERPRCKPWRFSTLEAGPDSHYVIATYDHWTADSTAARLILRHVLDRYNDWNVPENRRPLDLYPGTYREVFAHRLRGKGLLDAGMHSLRQLMGNRSVAQVPYSSSLQMDVRFELYRAAAESVSRLRHFSRSLGATVHDVILAALGRALVEFLPRRAMRRGDDVTLGTIVDTRAESREDLSASLGAFLSCFLAKLAADKDMSLADAVRCVAATTGPIKARRSYLDALLSFKLAGAVWPRLRAVDKPHFMRKRFPMTAGVSNVVVRDDWMTRSGGEIVEYFRGVSTGPILPLVLTPTTFGDDLSIGVTYRIAGFSGQKIDGIMDMFMDQIENPGEMRHGSHSHEISAAETIAAPHRQPAKAVA
jgi:NRPS condensation-like uncharacterized protein